MRFTGHLVAVTLSACVIGCNSISSTMLNRTDNDVFIGNSNGEPNSHCGARPFKGVPITLRVPTHLDVAITEKLYLRKDQKNRLVRVQTAHRNLSVEPTIIETDKVFTVDPKRPAAGTLGSTLTFGKDSGGKDNSQYFASIVNNIKDETIIDVTAALNTLMPTLKGMGTNAETGPKLPASLSGQLIVENRTIAWKRFDLDEPGFEHFVAEFVSQHMNGRDNGETYGNTNIPGWNSGASTASVVSGDLTGPTSLEPVPLVAPLTP